MSEPLTKEKLEEYMAMLKRGELDLDELKSGLIAVHGATSIEGAMTPVEFLEYIGVSLDEVEMTDELRTEFMEEFMEIQRQKKWMDLLKRMFAGYVDHPAPEYCKCGTRLISSLVYPFKGEIYESGYCVPCDVHVPNPRGSWSKWKPTPEDFYVQENENLRAARERQASGRWG